ncbi:MAG: MFS transporter [Pseudolabrys sp.]|nr:MFS transporter [Pseudolabrys sp.]
MAATGLFQNRWWVVFASVCGLIVGAGAINIFAFGVFLKPVSEDLGLGRGDFSTALLINGIFNALACPVVGWLIDRYGTRKVMIPGLILFAAAVACYGLMKATPFAMILVIFAVTGFVGGFQTPIPYAATVAQWFDRNRGLALGIATGGVGLGVALVPQFAGWMIAHVGWRNAYYGLAAAVMVLAWLPVALFIRAPASLTKAAAQNATANLTDSLPGIPASDAFKSGRFWALTIAFFLGVMAINGTLTHVVALLTDRGIPAQQAIGALSAAGLAIIGGRVLSGWALDRFWGPYIAMVFFVLPMIGIALLGSGAGGMVPLVGTVLCGMGIGAEIDLMAFFLSRYFGLKAYGKIYGIMFAIFNVGTGLGPAASGWAFQTYHSYVQIFGVYEVALAITCVLLVRLGPYPFPAPPRNAAAAEQKLAA